MPRSRREEPAPFLSRPAEQSSTVSLGLHDRAHVHPSAAESDAIGTAPDRRRVRLVSPGSGVDAFQGDWTWADPEVRLPRCLCGSDEIRRLPRGIHFHRCHADPRLATPKRDHMLPRLRLDAYRPSGPQPGYAARPEIYAVRHQGPEPASVAPKYESGRGITLARAEAMRAHRHDRETRRRPRPA